MPRSAATRHKVKGCEAVNQKSPFPYEDILHLPYPRPSKRARMSMVERAAQFAPFAALTGYDSAIKETARLTGQRVELDDSEKAALDEKLQQLLLRIGSRPEVTVTHFVNDLRKDGGEYITTTGALTKIDFHQRCLMVDGQIIRVDDILKLHSEEIPE